jgi:hypothetical protein
VGEDTPAQASGYKNKLKVEKCGRGIEKVATYRWLWEWAASEMGKCGQGKECTEGLVRTTIKWREIIKFIE